MSGETPTKARILAADDSRLIQRTILKMLGGEFDVIVADDGIHAWAILQDDPTIQVVFSDLDMPRMDGFELLRMIRTAADPGMRNLPVIIVTGAEDDEGARVEALEDGATDFVTKPFASVDLVARARAHSTYQRVTQQLRAATTLDPLTGLANRPGFVERLQQDIAYARRHDQSLSVVALEIEGFHTLFLRYGKETAEGLVTLVSKLLRATIRKEDTASRIGLGTFALSLPNGQPQGVAGMVDRLRADVLAQASQVDVMPVLVELRAAVLSVQVEAGPTAQDVLDKALAELTIARRGEAPAATEAPKPAPAAPKPAEPPKPAPPVGVSGPLLLDPLLDQIARGDPREAREKMPHVLNRLIPLLRLLSPKQRAALMGFLQKLEGG